MPGHETGAAAGWPPTRDALVDAQEALAAAAWTPFRPVGRVLVGACYACFAQAEPGRGLPDDTGWAAAALGEETAVASAVSP